MIIGIAFFFFFFLIVELNEEFNYVINMSEQLFNKDSFNSLQCYLLTLICL